MRRKAYIAAFGIIGLLTIGFFYVRSTPHYSLYMLKQAIEKHNPDEAMKYINIDSIVDNFSRNFINKNTKGVRQETSGGSSLKSMAADALPEIKDLIRSSIYEAIASYDKSKPKNGLKNTAPNKVTNGNSGKGNARTVPQEKTAVRLHKNQLFSIGEITIGNLDVRRIEKISLWDFVIQIDGKTAIVSVKDTPNIKARMAKTDAGHWQVVEVLLLP